MSIEAIQVTEGAVPHRTAASGRSRRGRSWRIAGIVALGAVHAIAGGCASRSDPYADLALRIAPGEIETSGPDRYTRWVRSETELEMSQPAAASVARRAMEDLGFEIFSDASTTHYVRSRAREIPIPDVCDCGSLDNGVAIDGKGDLILYASLRERSPGRTRLRLESECAAYLNQEKILCASAGGFELDFWDELAEAALESRVEDVGRAGDAAAPPNASTSPDSAPGEMER